MRASIQKHGLVLAGSMFVLAACSSPGAPTGPVAETASPLEAPSPVRGTLPESESPEPTDVATPTEVPLAELPEFPPVGAVADWTTSPDAVGIEGRVEVISSNELKISNFVFLAAEAPGVDIRIGLDGDFSEGVGHSLKNITGRVYEDRTLTLTVPDRAFDGRKYDSIAVFCFDTGEIFDWAKFELP